MIWSNSILFRILIILVMSLAVGSLNAQPELTMHFLDEVDQVNMTNPALFSNRKWSVALPSLSFNYGNAFTYHDIIKVRSGNASLLDVDGAIAKLGPKNTLDYQMDVDLFRLTFNLARTWHIALSARERLYYAMSYSKDFVDLLWNGNASFVGDTVEAGPEVNGSYYREFGITVGRQLGMVKLGIRLKYLAGLANISTERENLRIFTDEEYYQTNVYTDYVLRVAGRNNFAEDPLRAATNFKNQGFAYDVGISLNPDRHWSVSASLQDMGSIGWEDDVEKFTSNGSYQFNGMQLNQYLEFDTVSVESLLDSLKNTFFPDTIHEKFTGYLVPKVSILVRHNFDNNFSLGFLYYQQLFDHLKPDVALLASKQVASGVDVCSSVSYKDELFNLGFSAVVTKGPVQFFATTDNVVNLFLYKDSRNLNLSFGINILGGVY